MERMMFSSFAVEDYAKIGDDGFEIRLIRSLKSTRLGIEIQGWEVIA